MPAPVLGRGVPVDRSAPALSAALRRLGITDHEGGYLVDRVLADWQAIEIPAQRSRREKASHAARVVVLLLHVLAWLPRLVWRAFRGRKHVSAPVDEQQSVALAGSPEYGVTRLVKTSLGWAEFEFWRSSTARFGVYREDGWLALRSWRSSPPDLIHALQAHGLPDDEAESVANLVDAERQARLAQNS